MGQPAAKQGDKIVGVDTHVVIRPPPPPPPTPMALPHNFNGIVGGALSGDVKIMGLPAATVGSTADNVPPHAPTPPGASFQSPPPNKGKVTAGSATVRINGKAAARNGDPATICDQPGGSVVAAGTVTIGP